MRRRLSRGVLAAYRGQIRLRDKLFSVAVSGAFAGFGARTVLHLPIRLARVERISLGSDVTVGANSWLQTLGHPEGIAIEIGDGTSIAGNCVVSAAKAIRIGERVTIARGTYIADHSHAYERTDVPIADQGITNIAPIEIGDGAWLGENVVVSPGVTIGIGAVVGANAVVTKDVPAHTVAIGSPARPIRRFGVAPAESDEALSA